MTSENILSQRFGSSAQFYRIEDSVTAEDRFRSVLEILERESPFDDADAIFVMMNPGSSAPTESATRYDVLKHPSSALPSNPMVDATADKTQYQVMRVMEHFAWKRVRILNLSDLCDPRSGSFYDRFNALEKATGSAMHSIFAKERSSELSVRLMRKAYAPIVCAWGVNYRANPLSALAFKALREEVHDIVGWLKPRTERSFYHPLPQSWSRQREWIRTVIEQVEARRC